MRSKILSYFIDRSCGVALRLRMKQMRETQQRSTGHRYRELGISDTEPADPIGGCDISQRSRRQATSRHELAEADIEQHGAFVGPAPKPSSRKAEAASKGFGRVFHGRQAVEQRTE